MAYRPKKILDAAGGNATAALPWLWPAGLTDPRIRSFAPPELGTKSSILDPQIPVEKLLLDTFTNAGLPPPPDADLDRIALLFASAAGMSWDSSNSNWKNVRAWGLQAEAIDAWTQAVSLGDLPEDWQGESGTGPRPDTGARDWPRAGDNGERQVFRWGWGGKALYQHMQVQKFDTKEQRWRIFNKWGQDLTFVWNPKEKRWIAGWDFGDWLRQNAKDIGTAMQLAFSALVTLFSFGAGSAALATTGAVLAANQAAQTAAKAIAYGDLPAAIASIVSFGTSFAKIPGAGELKNLIPPQLGELTKLPGVKLFSQVFASSGTKGEPSDLDKLVKTALAVGKQVKATADEVSKIRDYIPEEQRIWFDRAVKLGPAAASLRGGIPWYAQPVWDQGAVMGTLVGENVGTHVVKGVSQMSTGPGATSAPIHASPIAMGAELEKYARALAPRYGLR